MSPLADQRGTSGLEEAAGDPGGGVPGIDGQGAPALWHSPGRRRSLVFAGGALALVVVLAVVLVAGVGSGSGSATTDVAPGINTAAANLLQLDTLPAHSRIRAPDFTLTDQNDTPVSLSQFRGKVVVLSFNDDRCPDLCTLLAQDIVLADRYLGPAAARVVFLSVNVNTFYPEVRYVTSWTDDHGLGALSNWYFGTGPVSQLTAIRNRYGVYLQTDPATRTVVHGTQLFFVGPTGSEAAIGQFGTNAASTSLYAHAMAQMAVDLLPGSERVAVGGPQVPEPSPTDAAVGAPAPSFSLPRLGTPHRSLSSAKLRGSYVVLNFWSSTCTACVQEMPHVEQAYRDLGAKVDFVGVDVSDSPRAAAAFARRVGAAYPLVSDASGTLAGAYRLSGLPFTVILDPHGTVVIRHPGSLTTEQLEYIVENVDQAAAPG
ncbi:MAG: redoxin domain-containing protein [Actinomycetota bacterium]|nr:redoxin domain-containing protein [Actinomycetota bacterium]